MSINPPTPMPSIMTAHARASPVLKLMATTTTDPGHVIIEMLRTDAYRSYGLKPGAVLIIDTHPECEPRPYALIVDDDGQRYLCHSAHPYLLHPSGRTWDLGGDDAERVRVIGYVTANLDLH